MTPDDADDDRANDAAGGAEDDEPEEGEEVPVDVETDDEDIEAAGGPVEGVDQRIVDVLSWILDTETRAKIYVYLLANPGSTSEEVAKGTGLYPSTVREALAELHDEERVTRDKRASEGAGNNPYEYTAIQPSELVSGVVDQFQHELNTVFNLDRILDRREPEDFPEDVEPVTITVDDADSARTDDSTDADGADDGGDVADSRTENGAEGIDDSDDDGADDEESDASD